jgi:rubrerythrin
MPNPDVRFGLVVDHENGHHVRFRVFSATGGQHLGGCGQLVMTADEFDAFSGLLGPKLTDRSDPDPARYAVPIGERPPDTKNRPVLAVETLRLYDAEIARLTAAGAPFESLQSWRDTRSQLISSMATTATPPYEGDDPASARMREIAFDRQADRPERLCTDRSGAAIGGPKNRCPVCQSSRGESDGDHVGVLAEVAAERARQDARWGDQSDVADADPDRLAMKDRPGYSDNPEWIGRSVSRMYASAGTADQAKQLCRREAREHGGTWAGIVAEEFYEWLEAIGISHGEGNPAKARTEAIQTAACLVAFVEALDKRGLKATPQRPSGGAAPQPVSEIPADAVSVNGAITDTDTVWVCGECGYHNGGPICTPCGCPRDTAQQDVGGHGV